MKSARVLRILGTGFLALSLLAAAGPVRAANSDQNQFLSKGGFAVTVLASAVGGGALYYQNQNQAIATARADSHATTVLSGGGDRLSQNLNPTLTETILRGTRPGDVVRVEFKVGTVDALDVAVADMQASVQIWEARVQQLTERRSALRLEIEEVGRIRHENSPKISAGLWKRISDLQAELVSLDKTLADADLRMHAARIQFQSGRLNLKSAKFLAKAGDQQLPVKTSVMCDILIDEKSEATLGRFFSRYIGMKEAREAIHDIPHVRINRVKSPNISMVRSAAKKARVGAVGVAIMAAVVIEELTVGYLGQKLEEQVTGTDAPAARTEPVN